MTISHSGLLINALKLSNETKCMHRHHVYVKTGNQVELAEVGPRFEMRRKLDKELLYRKEKETQSFLL